MSDFQNEQEEFYSYIDEELSFLSQAREQMRSYNDMFSARSMEERFVQSITPPDPLDDLLSPVEEIPAEAEIQQETTDEPAPRRIGRRSAFFKRIGKRAARDKEAKRGAGKVKKAALKLWDKAVSLWQKQSKKTRIIACSVTAVLLCVLILLVPWSAGEKEATIRRGVTIDGVSVAGLTRQEAIDKLSRPLDEKVAGTCIILTYAGDSWTLDSDVLGLHHDLPFVVDRALSLDRPNRLLDWVGELFGRKKDARALHTSIVVSEVILRTALARECGIVDETVVEGGVSFDPTAASEAGLFTITAPRSGRVIDLTRLIADIRVAANAGGVQQIAVQQMAVTPKHTLSELKLSVSCISQVSIDLSACSDAQRSNIASALSHINGVCVPAGKSFSFNDYAAPYSGENGYTMSRNEETGEYEAHGLELAATLVYRAGLLCDMKLLTRFAPQTPVDYAAVGLDAVVDSDRDLVFKNQSDYPVYLCASVADHTATVTVYGMPLADSMRVLVETEILEYGQTPAPNEVVNDGTHALTDGQSLDLVVSTPACTVRTWRIYYDKFQNELHREQIGTDTKYEEVIGTRIVAEQ